MAATGKLKYDTDWYQPKNLRAQMKAGDLGDVRKEYTRLRDIAQKRLKRMGQTRWSRTQTYLRNVNHYPKLKDIQSEAELAKRLSDLSRFISAKLSTVSGMNTQMKKSLKTLHEHDYNFVNEDNYIDFGKFMEEYRFQKLDEMGYDSGTAAEAFNQLEVHRVDPLKVKEDFEFWLQNQELLEDMYAGTGGEIQEKTLRSRLITHAAKTGQKVEGMTKEEEKKYKKIKKGR